MSDERAFFSFYESLPRQGPGDRASLDAALAPILVKPDARICDAGCGKGADIDGLLAHAPTGKVLAIDTHEPFIGMISKRYADDPRVSAKAQDMSDLGGSFDLIWSAGALYFLGLKKGLATLRSALALGGAIAVSYPAFFTSTPSDAATAFWAEESSVVANPGEIEDAVAEAGFKLLRAVPLPDAAWEAFYGPVDAMAAPADPAQAEVHAVTKAEAAAWRTVRGETGYLQITAVLDEH